MATHKDTTRSTKKSPQIPTDDHSAGFNGIGLCDYADNHNTNACCIQHTVLVEKAQSSQHRGPNLLPGPEAKHRCPDCDRKSAQKWLTALNHGQFWKSPKTPGAFNYGVLNFGVLDYGALIYGHFKLWPLQYLRGYHKCSSNV